MYLNNFFDKDSLIFRFGGTKELIEKYTFDHPVFAHGRTKFFYFYIMGYFLEKGIDIMIRTKKDFFTFMNHHIVTLYLMFYSVITGTIVWGTTILIIGFVTDMGILFTRYRKEAHGVDWISKTSFVLSYFVFFYYRIYVYGVEIIRPILILAFNLKET